MRWLLFSFFSFGLYAFDSKTCIESNFSTNVKLVTNFWGMIKPEFSLEKKRCLLSLNYKNILEESWQVDLCKEPIHIKVHQYFSDKVYVKKSNCSEEKDIFCKKRKEVLSLIKNQGLVFAKGERSTLDSEHGKVYCFYKLLQKHLDGFKVFDLNNLSSNIDLFDRDEVIVPKIEKNSIDEEEIEEKSEELKSVQKPKRVKKTIDEMQKADTVENSVEKSTAPPLDSF
jgi:hypothetical protein